MEIYTQITILILYQDTKLFLGRGDEKCIKTLVTKFQGKRILAIFRHIWEDNTEMYLGLIGCEERIKLANLKVDHTSSSDVS